MMGQDISTDAADAARDENNADVMVGRRLRALRLEAGLSLTELAGQAGISVGALSQIERGVSSLRVRTLWPLATALGVDAARLLEDSADSNDIYCVRAGNRRDIPVHSEGVRKQLLSPPGAALTGMLVEIEPGGGTAEAYSHQGHEFGFVMQGTAQLGIDGTTYHLRTGDSFAFRSLLLHSFRNDGEECCIIIWINATKKSEVRDDE